MSQSVDLEFGSDPETCEMVSKTSHSSRDTSPPSVQAIGGQAPGPSHFLESHDDSEVNSAKASGHHSTLELWYAEYMAEDGDEISRKSNAVVEADADDLDDDFIEDKICEKMSDTSVSRGFCATCQDLFDKWPLWHQSLAGTDPDGDFDRSWKHTTTRPVNTVELEASTRKGCRLCSYLLQTLADTDLLTTFRKIEARMARLGKDVLCFLSIQNWGLTSQLLWLNFPGKTCTYCNGNGAKARFQSDLLPPTGTYFVGRLFQQTYVLSCDLACFLGGII